MREKLIVKSLHPERLTYPLVKREVVVKRVDRLSPGFVRIVFTGDTLADFQSESFDDHIKFFFEDQSGNKVGRHYSVRRYDARQNELTLEFGLRSDGPAARWAQSARIGSRALIGGPKSSCILPPAYDWYLLAGDSSALPAILRRLEELPEGTNVLAFVRMDDLADERLIETRATATIRWSYSESAFVEQLRSACLPSGQGYAWGAAEANLANEMRKIICSEKGHPEDQASFKAYWRSGATGDH